MQYFIRTLVALVTFVSAVSVSAGSSVAPEVAEKIISGLQLARPGLPVTSVKDSPVDGIYKVAVRGNGVIYVSEDAKYMFTGKMLGIMPGEFVDLQDLELKPERQQMLASVDQADMVVFPAKGKRKAFISVFTDVDCGYCRKLHQEVPELNANGVEVRYLAFPRAGIGSRSHQKVVNAWCSDDRQQAMNRLKSGGSLEQLNCETPIAAQYQLGQEMGVSGTPAIFLADGTLLPGYLPAQELIKKLNL